MDATSTFDASLQTTLCNNCVKLEEEILDYDVAESVSNGNNCA